MAVATFLMRIGTLHVSEFSDNTIFSLLSYIDEEKHQILTFDLLELANVVLLVKETI